MVHLTQLPPEILHSILSHVEPEDTAYLRQTCHYLLTFIDGNRTLFRELYFRKMVSLTCTRRERVATNIVSPG